MGAGAPDRRYCSTRAAALRDERASPLGCPRRPLWTVAVAYTPAEPAGLLLTTGSKNRHSVPREGTFRREVVAHGGSDVHFLERPAALPRGLCATASTTCERAPRRDADDRFAGARRREPAVGRALPASSDGSVSGLTTDTLGSHPEVERSAATPEVRVRFRTPVRGDGRSGARTRRPSALRRRRLALRAKPIGGPGAGSGGTAGPCVAAGDWIAARARAPPAGAPDDTLSDKVLIASTTDPERSAITLVEQR
jgi:hypothetical protein